MNQKSLPHVILTIWGNHNFFKVKNHKLLLEMPFQRVNWDNLNTKYGVAHFELTDRF